MVNVTFCFVVLLFFFCKNHLLRCTHNIGFGKVSTLSYICPIPHVGISTPTPQGIHAHNLLIIIHKSSLLSQLLRRVTIFTEAPSYFPEDNPPCDRLLGTLGCRSLGLKCSSHFSAFWVLASPSERATMTRSAPFPSTMADPTHPCSQRLSLALALWRLESSGCQLHTCLLVGFLAAMHPLMVPQA